MFKSKTTKYIYISIITLLVVLLIFIIGYTLTSSKVSILTENSKTDISVFTSVGDYTTKYKLLNEVSDEYMTSNPDVSVKCTSFSDDSFNARLQTDFASGYNADIIITYPTRTMKSLFDNGALADLTPEFENDSTWYDSFDKSVLQFCMSDDKFFAAPMETELIVLYANKKLLSENGLAVPKTYAELKNCVSVLHNNGITPISFSTKDENLFLYQTLTAAFGKNNEIEHALEEQKFSPAYYDALNALKELYNLGAFPTNFTDMTRLEAQNLFIESNAAFIAESSSFSGDIENSIRLSDVSDTFAAVAFPSPYGYHSPSQKNFSPIIYGVGDMAIFVSSEAYRYKHDAVMDYVKYLTGTKVNSKFVSYVKYLSAIKNNADFSKNGPMITQCNLIILNSTEFSPVPSNIIDRYIWGHMIAENMYGILTGNVSYDDVLADIKKISGLCEKDGD